MIRTAAVICTCFLLTSTGYLAWVYHLMDLVTTQASDAVSMVAGYALQAVGIGLFALLMRRSAALAARSLPAALALHMLCLFPAVLSGSLPLVLASGFLLNLLCGWTAGYYLHRLAREAAPGRSARTLGIGYSASILASWLLSLIGRGSLYYSDRILAVCAVLTLPALGAARLSPEDADAAGAGFSPGQGMPSAEAPAQESAQVSTEPSPPAARTQTQRPADLPPSGRAQTQYPAEVLLSAGLLILLFSIVNNCGFAFPSADLEHGISLEFSRLFYAAGILLAGLVNDRSRKYGAVCAFAALVIPFIMLAIRGEAVPMLIFWALSYFTFGFYSVYRMVLFSDLARESGTLYLAGFGLLIGRAGDAAGEALCLTLTEDLLVLLGVSALFFIAATFLFFRLYPVLYMAAAPPAPVPVPASGTGLAPNAAIPASGAGLVPTYISIPAPGPGQAPAAAAVPTPGDAGGPRAELLRERETFQRFCARYGLSAREREVLRFLLDEKTNTEIADTLFISEGTVKYHIHNLLQKTGCRNRIALLAAYYTQGGKET